MTGLIPAVPPRSGSDTRDLIENALRGLAGRRGRRPGDPLTAITILASLIGQAERMIPELAAQARGERASRAGIATAPGASPGQAELRHSRRSPVRDTREPCDLTDPAALPTPSLPCFRFISPQIRNENKRFLTPGRYLS